MTFFYYLNIYDSGLDRIAMGHKVVAYRPQGSQRPGSPFMDFGPKIMMARILPIVVVKLTTQLWCVYIYQH